jgi:hypothetical protein
MTDDIAERVRKAGRATIRSIGHIGRLQRLRDNDADYVDPLDMLAELREDNRAILAVNSFAPRVGMVRPAIGYEGVSGTVQLGSQCRSTETTPVQRANSSAHGSSGNNLWTASSTSSLNNMRISEQVSRLKPRRTRRMKAWRRACAENFRAERVDCDGYCAFRRFNTAREHERGAERSV